MLPHEDDCDPSTQESLCPVFPSECCFSMWFYTGKLKETFLFKRDNRTKCKILLTSSGTGQCGNARGTCIEERMPCPGTIFSASSGQWRTLLSP